MRLRPGLLLLALLFSTAFLHAAETPIPPAPAQWVTDQAGFMSPQAAASLNQQVGEYARTSGHQILVYIGKTTGDTPLEDWVVKAFKAWKIGRKGMDDGLALFIFADDHKLRIEVGYGLEGQVPDAIASRIINEIIVPQVKAGDNDGAVFAGVGALVKVISGKDLPAATSAQRRGQMHPARPLSLGEKILLGIFAILVILFLITHPQAALFLMIMLLSGGRGGGRGGFGGSSGGGGGGFSGGGGSSGGGGASGSW